MRMFRKNKVLLSRGQERAAAGLARRILVAQRRLADEMNRRTRRVSVRQWQVGLLLFCIAFGAYCCWLLVEAMI